jgi:hypothetical protein
MGAVVGEAALLAKKASQSVMFPTILAVLGLGELAKASLADYHGALHQINPIGAPMELGMIICCCFASGLKSTEDFMPNYESNSPPEF